MGMAIETGRLTVSSPSSVCDARMRIKHLGQIWFGIRDELLELSNLADLFESEDLILLIAVYAKTCRIIASVFESR
jgi:hypothetical protein